MQKSFSTTEKHELKESNLGSVTLTSFKNSETADFKL